MSLVKRNRQKLQSNHWPEKQKSEEAVYQPTVSAECREAKKQRSKRDKKQDRLKARRPKSHKAGVPERSDWRCVHDFSLFDSMYLLVLWQVCVSKGRLVLSRSRHYPGH